LAATWLAVCVIAVTLLSSPTAIAAGAAPGEPERRLERRLSRVEARLDAEREARDRQADAFDAAASRIEIVNGVLVGLITLAGVLGALLALRWVRQLAHKQIVAQVEMAVAQKGEEIFEADSATLRAEYDGKFADLYRRYHRLFDEDR